MSPILGRQFQNSTEYMSVRPRYKRMSLTGQTIRNSHHFTYVPLNRPLFIYLLQFSYFFL